MAILNTFSGYLKSRQNVWKIPVKEFKDVTAILRTPFSRTSLSGCFRVLALTILDNRNIFFDRKHPNFLPSSPWKPTAGLCLSWILDHGFEHPISFLILSDNFHMWHTFRRRDLWKSKLIDKIIWLYFQLFQFTV